MTSPPPQPTLLDLDGVAARLNLSTRHVRRLVAERRIPFLKVGSLLRFDPEQIELWLRSLVVCSFDLPPGNERAPAPQPRTAARRALRPGAQPASPPRETRDRPKAAATPTVKRTG